MDKELFASKMEKNIKVILLKDFMRVKDSLNSKMEYKIHLNMIEKSKDRVKSKAFLVLVNFYMEKLNSHMMMIQLIKANFLMVSRLREN
jgi:hypothetical protein